ncbi:hypothetical protein [Paenibacillus sp. Soil724D2]|uniref:hypothetical protein n=1 Tax=Paenibacillus sp. (strain Soil724D2) TaxID=1736392 RepID=UPI00071335D5|nr:hypothetical protein [Paenibacillus sp. Soil724D2]KRE48399.1 hypothetical protein ASG85_05190 [Paenibacillus sp. Soil724D2]
MKQHTHLFDSIFCKIYGELSSKEKRQISRLKLKRTQKRTTSLEMQRLVEASGNSEEIINELPAVTQRRVRRALEIPRAWRDEVEKKRRSQDALAVIWHDLDVDKEFKNELLQRLVNTDKIKVDHATALKKMANLRAYRKLTFYQKQIAVENVLVEAKFTESEAEMIIIQSIMQTAPDPVFADFWVNFCSFELKHVSAKLSKEMGPMIRDTTVTHLISARDAINDIIDDLLGQRRARGVNPKEDQLRMTNEIATKKEKASLLDAAKFSNGIDIVKSKTVRFIAPRVEKTEKGFSVLISSD